MSGFIDQVWGYMGSSDKVFEGVSVNIGQFGSVAAICGRTRDGLVGLIGGRSTETR